MYSKILLAIGHSEVPDLLVSHLPHLISVGLKEVVLVHVVHIRDAGGLAGKFQESAKNRLNEYKRNLERKDLKVKIEVPIGLPSDEINEIADKEKVSLIMIGSHDRSFMGKVVFGGTSEQIIKESRKPVLIMKLNVKDGERCSLYCENVFETILYPTDFSNNAEKVLPYIRRALDAGCKKVVLLHVQEEQRIKPHLEHRLEEFNRIDQGRLDRIKKELLDLGVKEVKTVIEMGKTTPIIMRVSQEEGACLIAIGARGRSLMEEMFIGGAATNVVRHAKMPVLFVT